MHLPSAWRHARAVTEIDPLVRAQMEFTPVPPSKRRSPGRIKSVPARLYIDRFDEHRQAYEFLQDVQRLHGEGTKTLVRALLHWRDTVAAPLEEARAKTNGAPLKLSSELQRALMEFTPIDGRRSARIKSVSARLYVDKYLEHREAYEFLQGQRRLHGDVNRTIVKAILHYRDTVHRRLERQRRKRGGRSRRTAGQQMRLRGAS